MKSKERELLKLLELKYRAAESKVQSARQVCEDIDQKIEQVAGRRNVEPQDPRDQIYHERHIAWLDRRSRELSIMAAQAAAEFNNAKDQLRIEFGRKSALQKALEKRQLEDRRKALGQLS